MKVYETVELFLSYYKSHSKTRLGHTSWFLPSSMRNLGLREPREYYHREDALFSEQGH